MWVDHAQVERRVSDIGISESDKHGAVDSGIALKGRDVRLDGLRIVQTVAAADVVQRTVGGCGEFVSYRDVLV